MLDYLLSVLLLLHLVGNREANKKKKKEDKTAKTYSSCHYVHKGNINFFSNDHYTLIVMLNHLKQETGKKKGGGEEILQNVPEKM
ncbi:hypothetical protein BD770DRAFT_395640 [Pilaira anomala]|nr:hypothetical protein BD770DRAFT_395640 [Pilaira anomala]